MRLSHGLVKGGKNMCSIIGYCGRPDDMAAFQAAFSKTISRGPDDSRMIEAGEGYLGDRKSVV